MIPIRSWFYWKTKKKKTRHKNKSVGGTEGRKTKQDQNTRKSFCLVSFSFLRSAARHAKTVDNRETRRESTKRERFSDAGCRCTLVEATGQHSLTARHVGTWNTRRQTFCYANFLKKQFHGVLALMCIGLSSGGELKSGEAGGGLSRPPR